MNDPDFWLIVGCTWKSLHMNGGRLSAACVERNYWPVGLDPGLVGQNGDGSAPSSASLGGQYYGVRHNKQASQVLRSWQCKTHNTSTQARCALHGRVGSVVCSPNPSFVLKSMYKSAVCSRKAPWDKAPGPA